MTTPTLPRPADRWIDQVRRWYTEDAARGFARQAALYNVLDDAVAFAETLPTDGCSGCGDPMRASYGEPCACPVSYETYAEAREIRERAEAQVRATDPLALSGMDLSLYVRVLWVIRALDLFDSPAWPSAGDLPAIREEIEAQA